MTAPYFDDGQVTLYLGDCLEVPQEIPDASVDAVVCDPPYSLTFMGREWDHHDSPREFQSWCERWALECLRVLKPGGHLLAFGSPRTYHRLASGIEDAGFEIRDFIDWLYGQGFPKGVDIAKAIDKRREDRPDVLEVTRWLSARRMEAGWSIARMDALFGFNGMASHWCATAGKAASVPTLEQWATIRETLGFDDTEVLPLVERLNGRKGEIGEAYDLREVVAENPRGPRKSEHLYGEFSGDGRITLAASDPAKQWEGWNTQLKPAHEPIIVARKSTGFNTTVTNVLEHGTGALNIGACRTQAAGRPQRTAEFDGYESGVYGGGRSTGRATGMTDLGRWPTNVVFTHSPDCVQVGERVVKGDARSGQSKGTRLGGFVDIGSDLGDGRPNGSLHGDQVVPVFECAPGCPVAELDAQSGVLTSGANPSRRSSAKFGQAYGEFEGDRECAPARGADAGGASRFFPIFRYEAKAAKGERPMLADGTQHPTTKPLGLMRWLVRLVCPPGCTILDPFAGSGTTLEAAVLENFHAIGIEREQPYADLCVARLSKPLQPSLFGDANVEGGNRR